MLLSVPSSLRLANQRRVLEHLIRAGRASRAELALATGMSRPTAGKIVDELVAASVLVERAPRSGRRGRPGRAVAMDSRTLRFILIEVSVRSTSVTAMPLSPTGAVPAARTFATPSSEGAFLKKLAAELRGLAISRPWAFAISLPGVVDEESGVSIYSPNLHWTEGTNLPQRLRQLLGIPGCVLQEVRALALGQLWATPETQDFLLVDADDGLGAAAIIGGESFTSALPLAGELGHTRVLGNSRPCGCGATGCLETIVAKPGLEASYAKAGGSALAWPSLASQLRRRTTPRWLKTTMEAAGTVIGGALNVLGLSHVWLTGAFADLPADAIEHLRSAVEEGSLAARFVRVHVATAARRRAHGMVHSLLHRLVVPTADWKRPCVTSTFEFT